MKIIIAGGGIMGVCVAHFLERLGFKGEIVIYEQDISFQKASTHLSAASIRTQFSTPMCIEMSKFGLGEIKAAGLPFEEGGYLYLATNEGEETLKANNKIQRACDADIVLLTKTALQTKFPFLNLEDVLLGSFGQTGEGWFDAAMLHAHYKSLKFTQNKVVKLLEGAVQLASGEIEPYDVFINAAGSLSATLMPELPVEPRKRTVFVAKPLQPIHNLPLLIDPSGLWVRPEKEYILLGGGEDHETDKAAYDDFEPDYALFEEKLWPRLAQIIPAFESLKFIRAWAGHYDYNRFDQNGLIGKIPNYKNAYTLTGFSGHGLQHGAAAGRGLAELILFQHYQTLDLSCLSFERVLNNQPIRELNII